MPIIGNLEKPESGGRNVFKDLFAELTPEKKRKLTQIQLIRQNLGNFVSKQEQVEKLKSLIENSNVFKFKNKRNERVSYEHPVFILSWDWDKVKKFYGYESPYKSEYESIPDNKYDINTASKFKEDEDTIADIAKKEIFAPFSSWMTEFLVNLDKFKEFFEKEFNTELDPEDIEVIKKLNIITTNIFQSYIRLNTRTYQLIPQL